MIVFNIIVFICSLQYILTKYKCCSHSNRTDDFQNYCTELFVSFGLNQLFTDSSCLLTPEHSTSIQNAIGADIMMQLDDVVSSLTTGPRVEEAMGR